MKTAIRRTIIATAGVLLIGTLTACGYHHYRATPQEHINEVADEVSETLKLNEFQQGKLTALKSELLNIATQAKAEHESMHGTLEELFSQPTLDQLRLIELITQKSALINERAPAAVAALAGFYDSLTPEQQAKLRTEIQAHKQKHHGGWFH